MAKRTFLPTAALSMIGLIAWGIGSSAATDYNVYKIEYYNDGAYNACPVFHWKHNGTTYKQDLNCIENGGSKTADPSQISSDNQSVHDGDEIWFSIHIKAGDDVSCKKSGHHYLYASNVGTFAKFKTEGTTDNDNHCEIMCDQCSNN